MSRALAAVLLLATIAAPLSSQICTFPVTLRTEACPPGSGTGCTLKGSPLTWQEVDRTFLDVLGICRTVGAYTWEAPAPGFLRSDLLGSVSPAAASGVGACPAGELVGGLLDNAAPECRPVALANDPAACPAGTAVVDIDADGVLTCEPVVADHGDLAGLGDDDHPQYLLTSGRAGGQVLTGGVADGETLLIVSSSSAVKSPVQVDGGSGALRFAQWYRPSGGAALSFSNDNVFSGAARIVSGDLQLDSTLARISGQEVLMAGAVVYSWTNNAMSWQAGARDTSLQRSSPGVVRIGDALRLTPRAAPPVTCGDPATAGVLYTDDSPALCYCNGTAWSNLTPADGGACS